MRTDSNLRFLVIGKETSALRSVRDACARLGLSEMLVTPGWLDGAEMKCAYHSADIVAVLSEYEDPFPTINLEAMACARPVVGTMYGGTPEIVDDDQTGYIVDPSDTAQCVVRVRHLLSDAALRERFGQAARTRIRDHFTLAAQAVRMLELFS